MVKEGVEFRHRSVASNGFCNFVLSDQEVTHTRVSKVDA